MTVAAHLLARFQPLTRLSLLGILAFVTCLPITSVAQPAASPAPTAADSEFWRSAERIGTVDAMRAYLKAFPQGFYADLARASIDRMQGGRSSTTRSNNKPAADTALAAPSTTSTGLSVDPTPALSGAPTSGAITMLPGEVYHGPGPITVGYLGAKKQLVLPNGPWVLLAVADRQSGHRPPVPLVSMVFGQFSDGHLVSLMSYLFNGRTSSLRTWQEVEDCHADKRPNGSIGHVLQQRSARGCGWTVRMSSPAHVVDPAWEEAQRVVVRLGSSVPPPPLLFTRAYATDNVGNYLAIRRSDFIASVTTPAANAVPVTSPSGRAAWLNEFLPPMLEGLDKRLGATELEPNQTQTPRVRLTLPD